MGIEIVALIVVALLAGALLGWLLGGRKGQGLAVEHAALGERAAAADGLRATLARVEGELAAERAERQRLENDHSGLRAQHDLLVPMRDTLASERDHHQSECGRLSLELEAARVAREKEREANERLIAELKDVRESLPILFKAAAQRSLDEAQTKFLERANDRFQESENKAKASIGALLQPVHERLEKYEQAVGQVEAERRDAFGQLSGQIEAMRKGSERVSSEAANLVNALRNAPKARGRWGEQQLKNVLENCGLSEHTDFATEVSVDVEGGRLRPDAIVRVPGGRALVIDAKVSLNAYQDAFNAVDEAGRTAGLAAHAASLRAHVKGLADKAYWTQFDDAPDYVIMFVPGEHFLSAALEHDPTLWDFAFDRRVLLATPTNLVAIARTVSAVWRQEKLASEAAEIARLGKELHGRLAAMASHVVKLGRNLELANGAYNSFVGSLESQVLTQARRFESLNVADGTKRIDSASAVETSPRPLIKLTALADDAPEMLSA